MSFRTAEEIEVKFEAEKGSGVRYHVGDYHSIFYPNEVQAAKSAASRFPKLIVDGRLLTDRIPAARDVQPAPAPKSFTVAAETAIAEALEVPAVIEKKKRRAAAAKKPASDEPPAMLW